MKVKLTLRIEEDLVKKAKIYAAKAGKSVSSLVANYFSLFQMESKEDQELPPKVQSLKGILKERKVDEDHYRKYLEEKYL